MSAAFEVVAVAGGTLRVVGEFDLASVAAFNAAVEQMPAEGPIVLDLSELTFIDSAGLHALAACAQTLDGRGPLILANPTRWVVKVLGIVGLDKYPPIEIRQAA